MITVEGLSKAYRGRLAIDDVSFVAAPGRVTGFLGHDGAGKSTTMRIMVGLTPATTGRVTFGGNRYTDLPNPGLFVGVHLHAGKPRNHPITERTLAISARTMGLPTARVQAVLELVSLTPTDIRSPAGNSSADVRLRLGIAHALLGDPSVLILDEPQGRMGSAGRHWLRELLRARAESGAAVLISSNVLDDVDTIADDLVVIAHGRIVAQGSKDELLATRGTYVEAVEHVSLVDALRRAGINAIRAGDGLRSDAEPGRIGEVAAAVGVRLVELRPARSTALANIVPRNVVDLERGSRASAW